jgi:hypothetical protein
LGDTNRALPLQRLGLRRLGRRDHPRRALPPWSCGPLQSLVGKESSAPIGCALPLCRWHRTGYWPALLDSGVFPSLPLPRSLRPRDYPLLRFHPPPRYLSLRRPPDRLSAPAPLLGFTPLQRSQLRESTAPGLASPGSFRLQGFRTLLTVSSSRSPRVCFTPMALMGFRPSGVLPLKETHRLVVVCLALLAFLPFRSACHGPDGDGRPGPARLEFAAGPISPSGPRSPRESDTGGAVLAAIAGRSPPGLPPP